MKTSNLKSMLAVAAVSLSLMPAAHAEGGPGYADVRALIAAQGDAALSRIREELNVTLDVAAIPARPARPRFTAQPTVLKQRPTSPKVGA